MTTNARSFFNDQKWTKKNTHKENTIRGAKRDHESATTGALSFFFFCRVLLERRERNRDCFYGNGYISRDVFVNFLSPFCKKNGPKMTSSTKFKRCRIQCSLFVYTTNKETSRFIKRTWISTSQHKENTQLGRTTNCEKKRLR